MATQVTDLWLTGKGSWNHLDMRKHLVARLLLTASVLLAGCGGSDEESSSTTITHGAWSTTGLPSPCRLINATEVGQAYGQPVEQGLPQETWPPSCRFTLAQSPPDAIYVSDDSAPSGKADFDSRQRDPSAVKVDIGMGNAVWLPEHRSLDVLVGKTRVAVVITVANPPADALEKAQAVAVIATPRALPTDANN